MKLLILLLCLLTLAPAAYAEEEPTDETLEWAEKAGVDAKLLQGALNSSGYTAPEYLYTTGELVRPVLPPPPVSSVWLRIKQCETPNGGWNTNTGNGFYGGLQFDHSSWIAAGGGRYARDAHLATAAQQMEIADIWLRMTSWRSWPACSLRLGLR